MKLRWTCKDGKIRQDRLNKIYQSGYRGIISVCAMYACDKYAITDNSVKYLGRFRWGNDDFMKPNFLETYRNILKER